MMQNDDDLAAAPCKRNVSACNQHTAKSEESQSCLVEKLSPGERTGQAAWCSRHTATTQHRSMLNNTVLAAQLSRARCLLLNPLVWARFVVEGHARDQHATQMASVDN
jgi:hypothetical protein